VSPQEYNGVCAHAWQRRWKESFRNVNLTVFVGDQSSRADLQRVLREGRGGYDAIIEDGGHTMLQNQVSLSVLFPALKAGAWYTVEDLQTSYMAGHGGFKNFSTLNLLGDMIAWLSGDPSEENLAALDFGHIMPDVEHVDCYTEICVLQKYRTGEAPASTHARRRSALPTIRRQNTVSHTSRRETRVH
jgi:hypothetical protein